MVQDDSLEVIDDKVSYTAQELQQLLQTIQSAMHQHGGLRLVLQEVYGILGFVRFSIDHWYLYLITKASVVSEI